ncbi:helix-turn-helix transcriptional regulator [Aerococcus urinaeequi]|uniref:helix-turn-helix transcriptional regulator n=1 Tax=Aerococcus urinaeequi TaxID=51665 RepID=UPI003B46572F
MNEVKKMRRFVGLTQKEMAAYLGISLQWYWQKENAKTVFKDSEKVLIVELFKQDFPEITIEDIFFTQKVSKV